MTFYRKDLSPEEIRERLEYFPDTGEFVWRHRLGNTHEAKCWNPKFAGKSAGTIDRRGYRRIKIHGTYYAGHRLAWVWMTGEWPPEDVDHANCDKSDNRFSNLRLATRSQNCANVSKKSHNKSGLKGACYSKTQCAYHAQIKKDGKIYHLGWHETAEAAHAAYKAAALKFHGEFARVE